jgi:hypothetical protein
MMPREKLLMITPPATGLSFTLLFFFFGPGRLLWGQTTARGIHATAGLAWLRMPPTETEARLAQLRWYCAALCALCVALFIEAARVGFIYSHVRR